MRWRGLFVLVLLVAGLLALRALQDRAQAIETRPETTAFEDLDVGRVAEIHVEQLEQIFRVGLARDAEGRWWMTEPVAYPAADAAVAGLLDLLSGLRGIPVEEPRLAALGLDPPRAVVRFRAGERRGRVEIGAHDVDGARAFVRAVDGERAEVLRVRLDYASRVDLDRAEYRDRHATPIPASSVIAFRRRGVAVEEEGERDLGLDAALDPERGWVAQDPFVAALDPVMMGLLARGSAELRVQSYDADDVQDLGVFGLDAPRFSVGIESDRGERAELLFAPPPEGGEGRHWVACRAGFPFVWRVSADAALLLCTPALDLADRLLVRARRDAITKVRIGDVQIERAGAGFEVEEARGGRRPADSGAVQDLLARLEFASVQSYDPELSLGTARVAFEVELVDGRRFGGEIAPASDGAPATYRRRGDELVGTLSPEVAALADVRASDLRSLRVHTPEEIYLAALVVESGGVEARFERDTDRGTWSKSGGPGEPGHAFYAALERLLLLDGEAWVDAPEVLPPDAVRVRFEGPGGKLVGPVLAFTREAEGRALCVLGPGEALAVDGRIEDDLRALLH